MSNQTQPQIPPPVPGSTAHTIARKFIGPERIGVTPELIARSTALLATSIQVGIDYEAGKVRMELVAKLFKYRQALEKIANGYCEPALLIAKEALED